MDECNLTQKQSEGSFSDLLVNLKKPRVLVEKRATPRWTHQEIVDLKQYCEDGKTRKEIANLLHRTEDAVAFRIRKLKINQKPSLTEKQQKILNNGYPLYGPEVVSKQLRMSVSRTVYEAKKLGLFYQSRDKYNPPIPRKLLPYDMVKRASILERECPASKNRIDDSVVIFYDKNGPSTPMMAMNLSELLPMLEEHFNRRDGVTTGALLSGYKR